MYSYITFICKRLLSNLAQALHPNGSGDVLPWAELQGQLVHRYDPPQPGQEEHPRAVSSLDASHEGRGEPLGEIRGEKGSVGLWGWNSDNVDGQVNRKAFMCVFCF